MADDPRDLEALGQALGDLYRTTDEARRRDWDRSLSPEEMLSDRWERARRLGFGDRASIYASALVYGDMAVGPESWIGPWVLLDGSGGSLRIGAFCSISAGVQVYTHDTVGWALSGGELDHRVGPVEIGDNCHIGSQSIVVAGVTVGSRCVVGANSLVNRDVPDRTVVAGSPARPIGRVEGEGADVRLVFDDGGG